MTLFDSFLHRLADNIEGIQTPFQSYKDDPEGFAKDVLQVELWEAQKEILRSVAKNKYTAVSAAIATGKSFAAAVTALWFFNTRPNSKVVVTAPPPADRQIKDIIFAEIRSLQRAALGRGVPLVGGEPHTWSINANDNWWIQGFSIPQTGSREERIAKFHGHHAQGGVLVLADEANGIPPEVHEAIDNITTGAGCKVVQTSNPFVPSGPFWRATRDRDTKHIQISALDHPNVVTDSAVIPGAVDRATTQKRIDKFTRAIRLGDSEAEKLIFKVPWTGEKRVVTSPVFCYKVLGIFPWEAEGALIPYAWYHRARQNWDILIAEARSQGYDWPVDLPEPVGGLDVAEFGTDSNAFCVRSENFLYPFMRWNGLEPNMTADRAARLFRDLGLLRLNVDGIGVGADVAPLMRQWGLKQVYSVKVTWSPTDNTEEMQYYQLRDQLSWEGRRWFAEDDAAVPPDEDFEADCLAWDYKETRSGIRVTPKPQIKSRLGRSPDAWDSFILSLYQGREGGRMGQGMETMTLGRGGTRRGYFGVRR